MLDFTCYDTHHRIPLVPVVNFRVHEAADKAGAPRDMYFAKKYVLDLHLSVSFFANQANYEHARRNAETKATEHLFKDVYAAIQDVLTHAFKHNDHELFEAIEKAKSLCRGNTP